MDHANVNIVTNDWLEPDRYRAIYRTATMSYAGTFVVVSYKMEERGWLFKGIFEQE